MITKQRQLAQVPPQLFPLAQQLIERAGRGALNVALERLYTMVGLQIDACVAQFPELRKYNFEEIRKVLFGRADFEESMLFSSLTYFGPTGVAMNNLLLEQIPAFGMLLKMQLSKEILTRDTEPNEFSAHGSRSMISTTKVVSVSMGSSTAGNLWPGSETHCP